MARKFGRIEPARIPPELVQGAKDKKLVEQINLALNQIVTQTNTVLQRATARLTDLPLWTGGEVHTIRGDAITANDADYVIRHGLGVVPRYWVLLNFAWDAGNPDGSAETSQTPQIIRSLTTWTDTHVFFLIFNVPFLRYTILLIP